MATNHVTLTFLDLSTAHLSPLTRKRMSNLDEIGTIYYPKGDYGWFVYVHDPSDFPDLNEELPADLRACLEYARANGMQWLMFDCDASEVDGLRTYQDDVGRDADPELLALARSYARHLSIKHGREIIGSVTSAGKIAVREKKSSGMFATISKKFAQAMVLQALPVIDMQAQAKAA